MKEVYVGGIGMTVFGEHFLWDAVDMAIVAAESALKDGKVDREAIEAVYVGNMLAGVLDGQNHLGSHIAQRLGIDVPVYRLEAACASGGLAVQMGWQAVAGGMHETVLVIGTESMTKAGTQRVNKALEHAASDEERNAGIGFSGLYGIMARAYLEEYDLSEDVLWWGPALMHKQACSNPNAQYQKAFSPEQIGKSRMISEPLRLLECSPHTDGAAAVVLTSEKKRVCITGGVVVSGPPGLAERGTLTSIPTVQKAWKKMKDRYGVSATMMDVVEMHDCFSVGGIMALEDLEIAARGLGWKYLKDVYEGHDVVGPQVNVSGGLKACGHPVGATGVKQVVSVVKYLCSQEDARRGLTHNVGGTGGTAVLHCFERRG